MTDEEWREDLGEVYEWEEVLNLGGVALSPEELARVRLGEGSSPSTGGGDNS